MKDTTRKIRSLLKKAYKASLKDYSQGLSFVNQAESLASQLKHQSFSLDCLSMRALILTRTNNGDEFFKANNLLIEKSKRCSSFLHQAKALTNQGLFSWNHASYKQALECFEEAGKLLKKFRDPEDIALNFRNIGISWSKLGDSDKALKNLRRAVIWAKKTDDRKTEASVRYWYGYVLQADSRFQLALKHFLVALDIYKDIKEAHGQGLTYNSIGLIYRDTAAQRQKDSFNNSLVYFRKALHCAEKTSNYRLLADVYNNIGLVYLKKKKYDQTLQNYFLSLKVRVMSPFKENEAITLQNIGNVYKIKGEDDAAYKYFRQALDIRRDLGQRFYLISSLTLMLEFLSEKNMLQEADLVYEEIKQLEPKVKDKFSKITIRESLSKYFEAKGDYKQALIHFKKMRSLEDDYYNIKTDNQLKEMELKHKRKIVRLKHDKKIAREKEYAAKAMAVTVSHELSQPVTILQGYLELIIMHNRNFLEDNKNKYYVDNINIAMAKIDLLLKSLNRQKLIRYEPYSLDIDMVTLEK